MKYLLPCEIKTFIIIKTLVNRVHSTFVLIGKDCKTFSLSSLSFFLSIIQTNRPKESSVELFISIGYERLMIKIELFYLGFFKYKSRFVISDEVNPHLQMRFLIEKILQGIC